MFISCFIQLSFIKTLTRSLEICKSELKFPSHSLRVTSETCFFFYLVCSYWYICFCSYLSINFILFRYCFVSLQLNASHEPIFLSLIQKTLTITNRICTPLIFLPVFAHFSERGRKKPAKLNEMPTVTASHY